MEFPEIRKRLEQSFGISFNDKLWTIFEARKEIQAYHEGENEWSDLREIAEEYLDVQEDIESKAKPEPTTYREHPDASGTDPKSQSGKKRRDGVGIQEVTPVELPEEERLRGEIFEEYLAKVAAIEPNVRRYRRDVLHDQLLSPEQAVEFMRAPKQVGSYLGVFRPTSKRKRYQRVRFVNESGNAEYLDVWEDSVLGELALIAERLTGNFPWQEAQATHFVLTGRVPSVPPVRINYRLEEDFTEERRHYKRGVITLTVSSWVSAETIQRAYKDVQRRVREQRTKNQPVGEKRLKLLRFVLERIDSAELARKTLASRGELSANLIERNERRKLGEQLVKEWDSLHPYWAYGKCKQPGSLLWRDYNQAEKLVARPDYKPPREVIRARE
ncbi:MAG: hypothetical protein ACFB50_10270 [Rubrobacteraceae bacterium]